MIAAAGLVFKKIFDGAKKIFDEIVDAHANVGGVLSGSQVAESQATEGIVNLLGAVSKPVFSKVSDVTGLQQFSNLVTNRVKNSVAISRGLSQTRTQVLKQTGPSVSR